MSYILLIVAIFLYIIGFTIIISMLRGIIPPMPSSPKVVRAIIEQIERESSADSDITEIGSGYGYLLFKLAKHFRDKRVIGYEISLFPYMISMVIKRLFRIDNVEIKYGDAFKLIAYDKARIDCCIAYLCVSKKLDKELKEVYIKNIEELLILNTYPLEEKEADYISEKLDIFGSKIYVYRKDREKSDF